MDSMTIANTPSSISANHTTTYGGYLPKTEPSALQRQDPALNISAGLMTAMVAIPLALSISIVLSIKIGLATLACAYVIGWALSRPSTLGE